MLITIKKSLTLKFLDSLSFTFCLRLFGWSGAGLVERMRIGVGLESSHHLLPTAVWQVIPFNKSTHAHSTSDRKREKWKRWEKMQRQEGEVLIYVKKSAQNTSSNYGLTSVPFYSVSWTAFHRCVSTGVSSQWGQWTFLNDHPRTRRLSVMLCRSASDTAASRWNTEG